MKRRRGTSEERSAGTDGSPVAEETPSYVDHALARLLRHFLPEEKRYWVLVPATGAAAALLSVGFAYLLAAVQGAWFWFGDGDTVLEASSTSPTWVRLCLPLAGGAVVTLSAFLIGQRRRLQGTSGLIQTLAFHGGRLPLIRSVSTGAVSIVAVGTGASLGREGALITSGSSLGSWFGRRFRLEEHHVKVLLAAGAAAGIAAAYNVPIAASVFALEVLLGSFAFELFAPIIIGSVVATTIARAMISNEATYHVNVGFLTEAQIHVDMTAGILLGAILGVVSALFIRIFTSLDQLLRGLDRLRQWKPLLVMALVAVVGLPFPMLLGNGYDTVNAVLADGPLELSVVLLLLLPVLKIVLTALCRAAEIPGGLFTPSLFVGALLGAAFGILAGDVSPWNLSEPSIYALLGMGAILAGTLKAPITAVLMVFELTRSYNVVLPLMAACMASTLVAHVLQRGSLFTEPLRKKGITVPQTSTPTWIRQPKLRELINPDVGTVSAAARFHEVRDRFLRTPLEQDRLYVVTPDGRFLGAISLHEIKLFLRESEHLDTVIAADILDSSFPCVYAEDPMSRAVEILARSAAERLPVLESPQSRKLLGTVSKRDLLQNYETSALARRKAAGEDDDEDDG